MKSDYKKVDKSVKVGDEIFYKHGHRFSESNMVPCKVVETYPETDEIRVYFRSGPMKDKRSNFYKKM